MELIFIPCSVTLLNVLFGCSAIMLSLNGSIIPATYCLIAAALCDFFDGFLARKLNAISCFGSELDSLADAVSFCVAPAVVLYAALDGAYPWIGPCALALYICAGLWRLARFNTMAHSQKSKFIGLPTTGAALALSQIILYTDRIPLSTLICVGLLAALMVSTIPFPKLRINASSARRRSFSQRIVRGIKAFRSL